MRAVHVGRNIPPHERQMTEEPRARKNNEDKIDILKEILNDFII
jgi:hypothetical protein